MASYTNLLGKENVSSGQSDSPSRQSTSEKFLAPSISLQHDPLVVEMQTRKVVAGCAGLPENLIDVDSIKALLSSILSVKPKFF